MRIKNIVYLIVLSILFLPLNVFADNGFVFCKEPGVLSALKILGVLIYILRILLPIALIITASIEIGRVVINDDPREINKATKEFFYKIAISVFVFFLPALINSVLSGLASYTALINNTDYKRCQVCWHPDKFNSDTCDKYIREYSKDE